MAFLFTFRYASSPVALGPIAQKVLKLTEWMGDSGWSNDVFVEFFGQGSDTLLYISVWRKEDSGRSSDERREKPHLRAEANLLSNGLTEVRVRAVPETYGDMLWIELGHYFRIMAAQLGAPPDGGSVGDEPPPKLLAIPTDAERLWLERIRQARAQGISKWCRDHDIPRSTMTTRITSLKKKGLLLD